MLPLKLNSPVTSHVSIIAEPIMPSHLWQIIEELYLPYGIFLDYICSLIYSFTKYVLNILSPRYINE